MNRYRNKIIALTFAAALTAVCFAGCNQSSKTPPSDPDAGIVELDIIPDGGGEGFDNQDPTLPPDMNTTDEYFIVTDASGQAVTEFAPVVDESGAIVMTDIEVLDENGNPVTENGVAVTTAVQVTQVVTATMPNPDFGRLPAAEAAVITKCSSIWVDVTKEADYIFNDYFLEFDVKINENTPDGKYLIDVFNPDFGNFNGTPMKGVTNAVNGYIYVNQAVEAQDIPNDGKFRVVAESVSGKPGETVRLRFKMINNPGVVGMHLQFKYDKSAVTVISGESVGEFAEIARPKTYK